MGMALLPLCCASSLCHLPALWWEGRVGGPCTPGDALRAGPRGRAGCGVLWPREPLRSSRALGQARSQGRFLARESLPGWWVGLGSHKFKVNWDLASNAEVRGKVPPGVPGWPPLRVSADCCGGLRSYPVRLASGCWEAFSPTATPQLPASRGAHPEESPVPFVLGVLALSPPSLLPGLAGLGPVEPPCPTPR